MWTELSQPIGELRPDQVFVFGSNRGEHNLSGARHGPGGGFHGAGGAGQAMRGERSNTWRGDPAFRQAMNAPRGHPDRVGHWAVYGVCRGPMQGRCGKSYAIFTVTHPGARRSVPLQIIGEQIRELIAFARARPALEFVVTPLGEDLAGYRQDELDPLWQACAPLPTNVIFVRLSRTAASGHRSPP